MNKLQSIVDINHYDELQLYFGRDFTVSDAITIHQPTVGEIVDWGEMKYYSMVSTLCAIPSDMKSLLFDMGIDYEELTDFQLFCLLCRNFTPEDTSILFGDLDFSAMQVMQEEEVFFLQSPEGGAKIDEIVYLRIIGYLRKLHGFSPKVEKAASMTVKKILIQLDRDKRQRTVSQEAGSHLKPLISAMMRYPGFKYNLQELARCGLYEFMDSISGAQIYIQSVALLQGAYSGMVDTSKIDKNNFNWMRDSNPG